MVLGVLAVGLRNRVKDDSYALVVRLVILFVLVQGPSLLFLHTNERNLSRSLPLGILAVVLLIEAVWRKAGPRSRMSLALLFCAWIVAAQVSTHEKVEGIVAMHACGSAFLDSVQRLMPMPPPREIWFACESAPKGYSEYDQPFWLFMPGTSDVGLRYRYGDPSFQSNFYIVPDQSSIPDSLPRPDFWVTRIGEVVDMRGLRKTIR
jgi:hypothetical protein